jgi:hypothetical protein
MEYEYRSSQSKREPPESVGELGQLQRRLHHAPTNNGMIDYGACVVAWWHDTLVLHILRTRSQAYESDDEYIPRYLRSAYATQERQP